MPPVLEAKHLRKTYDMGAVTTVALDDVSFSINKGEFVAIMGPSGSGKSTLMHILGALDVPTSGQYFLDDKELSRLSDDELSDIRNQKIGFIFQAFNLLPRISSVKNVMLPMVYAGMPETEREEKARHFLELVGLGHRLHHMPNQLSGGQQQRVAIARGLAMNPAILLADEPTGNIATNQAEEIMSIFQQLNDDGHTIVMITHEPDIAHHAKRIIHIRDGVITKDEKTKQHRSTAVVEKEAQDWAG